MIQVANRIAKVFRGTNGCGRMVEQRSSASRRIRGSLSCYGQRCEKFLGRFIDFMTHL